jgi:hypothetical protein
VARLNEEEPNNLVAGELLPLEWKHPEYLHLLSLANWGLEEGIKVGVGGLAVSQKAVEDTVLAMADWDPQNALNFIQGTPPAQGVDHVADAVREDCHTAGLSDAIEDNALLARWSFPGALDLADHQAAVLHLTPQIGAPPECGLDVPTFHLEGPRCSSARPTRLLDVRAERPERHVARRAREQGRYHRSLLARSSVRFSRQAGRELRCRRDQRRGGGDDGRGGDLGAHRQHDAGSELLELLRGPA